MNTANTQVNITLPDGSVKSFSSGTSVTAIAESIGPGLAKSTIAGEVNGRLVDACDPITNDANVRIITSRDPEGVEVIRHSCAHLVGHAVKQLYPNAKMVIGPVIENGFYYDIAYERPFTSEDLIAIEERMKQLIATHYDVIKHVTAREKVIETFESRQESYKLQLVSDMPNEKSMGLYYHKEYIDICLLYTSPSPRDKRQSRMPSSA